MTGTPCLTILLILRQYLFSNTILTATGVLYYMTMTLTKFLIPVNYLAC